VCFCVSIGHYITMLPSFVVLDLVSLLQRQEIGWEERLRNKRGVVRVT